MFVSKHHYAIELAKYGNTVFFLNPPDVVGKKEKIRIETSGLYPGLFIIHHQLFFPYNIKFRFTGIFHQLMKFHIKLILKKIGKPIDIIWSFDLGNLYPFRFFPATAFKIFHPVDEPLNKSSMESCEGAQVVFSVTHEILEKYRVYKIPSFFINHGLGEEFLYYPPPSLSVKKPVHIGFSGNLLRSDIDRTTLLLIIRENTDIVFECWGSYQLKDTNIGGSEDITTRDFVRQLQTSSNVKLHGVVASAQLVMEYLRMDAFLICYDVMKDQSKGTNYHKVMEFISTGKVIISNNITTYCDRPDLVKMVAERDNNAQLPVLFKQVMSSLFEYNSIKLQQIRREYAAGNTYKKQVEKIEQLVL